MPEGTVIREGMTDLFVPLQHSSGGPGKILNCVFFNEQMAFNRDVSVMVLRSLDKEMKVADCMTATGSRAVRIANEAPKTEVVANDINSGAIPFIEENIRINNLTNCRPSRRNLHFLPKKSLITSIWIHSVHRCRSCIPQFRDADAAESLQSQRQILHLWQVLTGQSVKGVMTQGL